MAENSSKRRLVQPPYLGDYGFTFSRKVFTMLLSYAYDLQYVQTCE